MGKTLIKTPLTERYRLTTMLWGSSRYWGVREALPEVLSKIQNQFGWINDWAPSGQLFMFGAEPGLLDAFCYCLIWFLRSRFSEGPDLIDNFNHLSKWERRIELIGQGTHINLSSKETLLIARQSRPVKRYDS